MIKVNNNVFVVKFTDSASIFLFFLKRNLIFFSYNTIKNPA